MTDDTFGASDVGPKCSLILWLSLCLWQGEKKLRQDEVRRFFWFDAGVQQFPESSF
jgi:hypothetical protein